VEHETGFENESSSGYINRNVSRYMYETSHFHGKKPPCRIQFAGKARSFKCEISLPCDKCCLKHWWICKPFVQVNAKLQAGGNISTGVVLANKYNIYNMQIK